MRSSLLYYVGALPELPHVNYSGWIPPPPEPGRDEALISESRNLELKRGARFTRYTFALPEDRGPGRPCETFPGGQVSEAISARQSPHDNTEEEG